MSYFKHHVDCILEYTTWFESMSCSVSTVMPQNYLDLLGGQAPKMGIYLLSLHL